jgi:hypothetical protein
LLRRRWPRRRGWNVCAETIYEAVYQGITVATNPQMLRTGPDVSAQARPAAKHNRSIQLSGATTSANRDLEAKTRGLAR